MRVIPDQLRTGLVVSLEISQAREIEHELAKLPTRSDGQLTQFWRALHNALQDLGRSTLAVRITDANHGTTND